MLKYEKALVSIIVLIFVLSTAVTLPPTNAGTTTNSLIKRALINGTYDSASYIATKADLFVCHYDWGEIVPQIHSIRPDVTVLLYRNLRAVSIDSAEWSLAVSNNWILKDAQGSYLYDVGIPSLYLVDKANPSYQDWVAQWLKTHTDQYGFDGVYADCSGYPWISEVTFGSNWQAGWVGPPINPRTGNAYTDAEWRDAEISLANKVKSVIGPKLLVENGVFCGTFFFQRPYSDVLLQSRVDGTVSEGWMLNLNYPQWYTESQWRDAINFASWMGNTLFPQKSAGTFLVVSQNAEPLDLSFPFLPPGTTDRQYATFVYASLLLGVTNTGSTYLNLGHYTDSDFAQSLYAIDIGNPITDYYMISGTHVYARDFANAKVLVNPTDTAYTANFDGNYQTNDGTYVYSSITVQPHTAIILRSLNAGTTNVASAATGARLTVLNSQNGRALPGTGTYSYPEITSDVWLTAFADAGYVLDYWLIDGVVAGNVSPKYLYMGADHTVQAVFKSTNAAATEAVFQSGFETGDFSNWASTYATSGSSVELYSFSYGGHTVPDSQPWAAIRYQDPTPTTNL
jgi:hypothetical protein